MFKNKFISLPCLAIFFCSKLALAQNFKILAPEEYLTQVKGQSLSYLAAEQNVEAFEKLKEKAKLVTAFNFFASTQNGFTEQNQVLQIFRYTSVYNRNHQVGISQTADFGLSTKLYYSLNHTTYKGLDTSNFSNPNLARSNYQGTPVIEVTLPLWQNRFGSSTKALKDAAYFSNESQKLAAKAISIETLVAAEQGYWNLVAARRAVEIQKNALQSAEQILNYVAKKEKMNLGEKGDVLQAKALLESRKLSLKQAENDEKLAARYFNKNRYVNSAEVSEKLAPFDFVKLKNFLVPQIKQHDRFDIKASEANMKAAVANAKVDEENNKPSLNAFGAYSQNQINSGFNDSIAAVPDRVGRSATVGLKLSVPINFGMSSDIRQGARQSAAAAKTNYHQKVFEQENDWQNLLQNLQIYKENLALAQAIETAQKLKLENERKLLKQGRTTTYQILLFEQDFSNSQLTTIQTAYKMANLIAQQKLYQTQE
jgi:outer membrane protein TolC